MIAQANRHITCLYPDPIRSVTFTDLYSGGGDGLTGRLGVSRHPDRRRLFRVRIQADTRAR
jgi:hypothetical protein